MNNHKYITIFSLLIVVFLFTGIGKVEAASINFSNIQVTAIKDNSVVN